MHKLQALECLRGFAALYVLVGHLLLAGLQIEHPAVRFALQFGQEAVMVFFLLSGFVIFWSLRPETSFRQYFVQRARRIFPIFIIALLLAYAGACWKTQSLVAVQWTTLLGNLVMMQDLAFLKPGVWCDVYHGNLPLWSLAYEWWFYLMFYPIERFVPARLRVPVVVAISASGLLWYTLWPMQPALYLMYFLIWWLGVEIARAYRAGQEAGSAPLVGTRPLSIARAIAVPLALLMAETAALAARAWFEHQYHGMELRPGLDPVLPLRHFAAVCGIVVLGLAWQRIGFRGFGVLFAPFIVFAPISYALYVIHFPILTAGLFDGLPPLVQAVAYLAVFLALAWVLEVRLQAFINRITRPWLGGPRVVANPAVISTTTHGLRTTEIPVKSLGK